MNLLLDTHTLLWLVDGAPELSGRAAAEIASTTNAKHVSVASLWEIAIKVSTRKLTLARPLAEFIADLRGTGLIHFVPIADAHLVTVAGLPFHHRDPFDRLLVAQALVDGFTVVGNDAEFDDYGVTRIWYCGVLNTCHENIGWLVRHHRERPERQRPGTHRHRPQRDRRDEVLPSRDRQTVA